MLVLIVIYIFIKYFSLNIPSKSLTLYKKIITKFIITGITAVLTLSTIALDSRRDLPKVHYATALDWFIICSFGYCIATLLEFAGVHYFTKVNFP